MRQYSAAIYANENLLLTEVLEKIEKELPLIEVTLFGNSLAHTSFTTSSNEYDVHPAGMIKDEEILIVLSDPQDDMELLKKFDGDIIDFTGAFTGEDVYKVEEPLAYIINALGQKPEDMDAVALVPAAVFGKNGIDDMINQTRELFTFSNAETKVFEDRLAFNLFFSDNEQGILSGFRRKLKADTGLDVDIRMGAISTGFVLDVYFKKAINKDVSNITELVGFVSTLSEIGANKRPVTITRNSTRISIAGDYLNVITSQVAEALKDIIGE